MAGVVGIDGSPTCGVNTTIKLRGCDPILRITVESTTPASLNALLRGSSTAGSGLFIEELQKELRRRRIVVPFLAHDLWAEIDGKLSKVVL